MAATNWFAALHCDPLEVDGWIERFSDAEATDFKARTGVLDAVEAEHIGVFIFTVQVPVRGQPKPFKLSLG